MIWTSLGQDGSGRGVYAQDYSAAGTPLHREFRVNTTTANDQWQSSLATLADGNAVATWTSFGQDGSQEGVYGQRLKLRH